MSILAVCWAANVLTCLWAASFFISKDFIGIYRFIIYGRIFLIFGFVASSGIEH